MKQVASLQYGVVFKKAFCDPEIFSAFIRDLLGIDIAVDRVETEKEFNPPVGYIKPRFDLFAEDFAHRVIVDIQHARLTDHYDRFLYYHSAALLEQVRNSKDYHPKLKVFTVVVLTSGDRHKRDLALIDFDPRDMQGEPLHEIPHKILYVCPKYVTEQTQEPCREWLAAINDTLDEEVDETQYQRSEIHRLFEHIRQDRISPEERDRMIEEYHQEELHRTGFDEGKLFVAKGMMKKGIAHDVIAELTGISAEELKELPDA